MKIFILLSAFILSHSSQAGWDNLEKHFKLQKPLSNGKLFKRTCFDRYFYKKIKKCYQPVTGLFKSPLTHPNPDKFFRGLKAKRWQYFSLNIFNKGKRYLLGFAVADVSYLKQYFFYLYDVKNKKLFEIEKNAYLPGPFKVSRSSVSGKTYFKKPGRKVHQVIEVINGQTPNRVSFHDIKFNIFKKGMHIKGKFRIKAFGQPFVDARAVSKKEPYRIVYAHKNSLYYPETYMGGGNGNGFLNINGKTMSINRKNTFATMDYTFGIHPRATAWNWAAFSGFAYSLKQKKKVIVAINVDNDLRSSSQNHLGHAVVWIDGKMIRLKQANFRYPCSNLKAAKNFQKKDKKKLLPHLYRKCPPSQKSATWLIKGLGKAKMNLTFQSFGKRSSYFSTPKFLGKWYIISDFHQPFGKFTGFIEHPKWGKFILGKDVYGVVEEHLAYW